MSRARRRDADATHGVRQRWCRAMADIEGDAEVFLATKDAEDIGIIDRD